MQKNAVNIGFDNQALLKRWRQGNSTAAEQLLLKYQNRIYNVIFKMCGNADDSAELTQDTFVKAIENIDKFEGRSGFYTWIFRIAVNLTLNYCKRGASRSFSSLDAEGIDDNGQARGILKEVLSDHNSPDPAMIAQNRELQQIALKGLSKLEDEHRAVIVLRDIEGMNYAQIAEVLNIELGTMKSRLSRARSNLREILEANLQ